MKYPCKTCLVDPICRENCHLLNNYMRYLDENKKTIFDNMIKNSNRVFRVLNSACEPNITSLFYNSTIDLCTYRLMELI